MVGEGEKGKGLCMRDGGCEGLRKKGRERRKGESRKRKMERKEKEGKRDMSEEQR